MADKPVLLVSRRLPEAVEARAALDYRARLGPTDDGTDLAARAAGADALLVAPGDRLTAAVVHALPASVRIVATFSVGYDHIDVAAARARGIVVTNTPGVLTDATADVAMLLILGAARRAAEGDRLVRSGTWDGWKPTQMLGTHIGGKRLGIVGMGRIGRALAHRARAFGMTIHYLNRRRLPPEMERGAVWHETPESLLAASDVLSLHAPATPETRRFLDARRIEALPPGAIVVNTARGALVDDEALIAALGSGRVAAAGLDVYENEPDIHPGYAKLPNTFLLPHLGSATVETRNAMGFKALDNLDAFFAGREPPDRIA